LKLVVRPVTQESTAQRADKFGESPMPEALTFDRRALLQSAGAIGLASALPLPAVAAIRATTIAAVQAVIDRWVAEKKLPGAVVAIGEGTAPPTYVMGGTLAFDRTTRVDENTIWRLASLTKPITGMATMLLIAEGKLGLDQPIGELIPAFARPLVLADPATKATRAAAWPITIRHLMTHTSGMTGLASDNAGGPPAATSLAAYVDQLARQPLIAEPGAKYHYANGLEVASRLIEIASGMPFDTFLQERFFTPLRMNSTGFWVREANRARLATSYSLRDGKLVAGELPYTARLLAPPTFPRASGGLVSTAHDYDRWLAMILGEGTLDGVTVMPASAVRMGVSNLMPAGVDTSEFPPFAIMGGYGAGGYSINVPPNVGNYGWGGASGTTAFANPRTQSRVSTFTNIGSGPFGQEAVAAATGIPSPGGTSPGQSAPARIAPPVRAPGERG
jgi:CubicO group peptidase (beta-lactamase class C family)